MNKHIDIVVRSLTTVDCVVLKLGGLYDFGVFFRDRKTGLTCRSFCLQIDFQACIEGGVSRFR